MLKMAGVALPVLQRNYLFLVISITFACGETASMTIARYWWSACELNSVHPSIRPSHRPLESEIEKHTQTKGLDVCSVVVVFANIFFYRRMLIKQWDIWIDVCTRGKTDTPHTHTRKLNIHILFSTVIGMVFSVHRILWWGTSMIFIYRNVRSMRCMRLCIYIFYLMFICTCGELIGSSWVDNIEYTKRVVFLMDL